MGNSLGKVGLAQRIVVAAGLLIRVGNRRPIYSKCPDSWAETQWQPSILN